MNNYQHIALDSMDDTGFGIDYHQELSTYSPPHWHKAVELFLFVSGRVTCKFENATIHGKPGGIAIINPHEVHETRCSRKASYLCVHIQPSVMRKFVPNFDQLHFSFVFDPEDQGKSMAYEQLRIHLQEILRQTEGEHTAYKLERQARLYALTAILVKHFSQPLAMEETELRRSDMTRLEPLLEHIRLHHGEDLSLEDAASSVGLNKEYFCRLFKRNMGVTYLHYVYQVRTTAVCWELETSEDPIGEIAERHGFKDPKMLSQYFRELYGCTPSEKRRFFHQVVLGDGEEEPDGD